MRNTLAHMNAVLVGDMYFIADQREIERFVALCNGMDVEVMTFPLVDDNTRRGYVLAALREQAARGGATPQMMHAYGDFDLTSIPKEPTCPEESAIPTA